MAATNQTREEIAREFNDLTDTPAHIRAWTRADNEELRERASLEEDEKTPSGRYHAERVLKLLEKSTGDWTDEDYDFASRVVNYARRSAGIAHHHRHREDAEIGDSGMTKNEIARRNWGLPARPAK